MTSKDIMRAVCEERGITLEQLLGSSRGFFVVDARRETIARLRAAGRSLGQISRMMGRDIATITWHLSPEKRATVRQRTRDRDRGLSVEVSRRYLPALERYASATDASITAVVNQAISDMLESA